MRFSYLLPTILALYVATASSVRLDHTKNSLDSIPVISSHDSRVEQAQMLKKRQLPGLPVVPGLTPAAPTAQTAQGQPPAQGPAQSFSIVSGPQNMGNLPAEVVNNVMQLPAQAPTQLQGAATQLLGSVKFGR